MAGYCRQCGLDLFRHDFREFADLIDPEDVREGRCCPVICEGCGPTLVDHKGRCVSEECPEHAA